MKKIYHIKSGDKYNKLTAIKFDHVGKHYRSFFLFRCDCGNLKVIHGSAVISGNTKSCGCLSKEIKRRRISKHHSEVTAVILGYKRHALKRGYKWELSRKDVELIIKQNCYYCGQKPSNNKKIKNSLDNGMSYSGIDRVDSKKHYTIDNVVPCCKICNYAKSNMDVVQFRKWAIQLGQNAMAEQWG